MQRYLFDAKYVLIGGVFVLLCLCSGASSAEAQEADGEHQPTAEETVTAAEPADQTHAAGADAHAEAGEDHADGGGHHDPTDLSHMNASRGIEDPGQFKSDLAVWTFVLFLCLLAVLAKFAWGPIIGGLEKREQAIAAKIDEAQRSVEQAARQLQQYEAKLASATEEAREIVAEARRDAESTGARLIAEAQEAASRERQRAIEDIQSAKNVAVQEITERSVELAVAMAGQLIRREVNATDRAQLVRDALDQIPSKN